MLDIETLRVIWWALLGILIMGFAVTDGFDFGVAILFPLITRNELERLIVLRTLTPFWEGNQVWIILGAGSIFAAWPFVYAVAFSGFYFLMLLLLLTMGISRPVSFKYRSKLPNVSWQRTWDRIVFIGGFCPALIFGMLIGNILLGLPFYFDTDLTIHYTGSFFELWHAFTLFCGLTSLAMLVMHGGCYLAIKTVAPLRQRAIHWTRMAAFSTILLFALGGFWISQTIVGYELLKPVNPFGFSNPLHKEVGRSVGAWLHNYSVYPFAFLAPLLGFIGAFATLLTANVGRGYIAFFFSSLSLLGIIATVGISMFPFILPSSTHPNSSLLVWDASSSQLTLMIMLVATIIFLPIIFLYTSWVYYALRGKITQTLIEKEDSHHPTESSP